MSLPEGTLPLTAGAWQQVVLGDTFADALGPFYRLDYGDPGEPYRIGFIIEARHCNLIGSCHGGMLATVLDIALGFVGRMACGEALPTPTISLALDFLQPAWAGEWIETSIRLVHHTRGMIFAEGRLCTARGVIARANATYKRPSRPAAAAAEPA